MSIAVTGDESVSLDPTALSFDANDWATPKMVQVRAAEDDNATNGSATLAVSGQGLQTREVVLAVLDNDESAPLFTSAPPTTAVTGASYAYTAARPSV